jgi:3-oxoacyl-[acyl-carrier-protein] synthase-1
MAGVLVHSGGMVSAVGLSAAASCAAIRAGLSGFRDTRFLDEAGDWLGGAQIDLEGAGAGRERLRRSLALALEESCTASRGCSSRPTTRWARC